jgi:hypothetical protein
MELLFLILSFTAGIAFLYLCYRAFMYVKERWGLPYAIILVLVIMLFSKENTNAENTNKQDTQKWEFASRDSVTERDNAAVYTDLEKNTLSTYKMLIYYGISKSQHIKVPVTVYFAKTGFGDATEWQASSIRLEDVDAKDRIEYSIQGILNWKLFGHVIYRQAKSYHGFAILRN